MSKSVSKINESFVKTLETNVCGRFGDSYSILRPWFLRYIPKGGHPMSIDYIDTKPDVDVNDNSIKTILILHSTPGSYYDFFRFIATFGEEYRIIIPNFPTFSYTMKTGCFWHSSEEKSEFVFDFLKQLNISQIDCLIAHSMAAYTASYLWIYANSNNYLKLKSVCLLSPMGKFSFTKKERLRLSLITNMSRSLSLRNLLPQKILHPDKVPAQNLFYNYELSTWRSVTLKLSNYENYMKRLRQLSIMKLPTLFTFSSNDKICSEDIFHQQIFELNATNEDFDIYEQYENILIQSSSNKSWIRVVDFQSAGHYMFNTHSEVIHSYIAELLDKCLEDREPIEES